MKKIVVLFLLTTLLIGSCASIGQSAVSNAAHSIIGTWIQDNGTVWVFNANGTGTAGKDNFTYALSAKSDIYLSNGWGARTLFMSPDGKRMFIMGNEFTKK